MSSSAAAQHLPELGVVIVAAGTGDVWHDSAHRAFAARLGARALILPTGHSPCETTPHQLCLDLFELFRRAER